MANFDSV